MKKVFLALLILLNFSYSVYSMPADVEDISFQKYQPAVKKAISKAEKEIRASLYYISYNPKGSVSELMNELLRAKKRGVDIEIILDAGCGLKNDNTPSMKNVKAFSFLKQNGIKVFYDDKETLNHSKYLVIDGKIVIVGSFNWSNQSLEKNRENAVLIRSEEMAREYLQYFKEIPKALPVKQKEGIPIPKSFMSNKDLAYKMFKNTDNKMFDFYLLCQKLSYEQKTRDIKISEEVLEEIYFKGKGLVLKERRATGYFKDNILSKNKDEYKFIRSYRNNEKERILEVTLQEGDKGEDGFLFLSELYWHGRWFDRLKPGAKFFWFYLLYKTESAALGRSIQISQPEIQKEFDIAESAITPASTELERYNLIEKEVYSEKDNHIPNVYILNDFYNYSEFEKRINILKEKTPPEIFEISRKLCDITNEPNDLECLKEVITLGEQYGTEALKQVYDEIGKKGNNSAYRKFDYMVKVVQGEGRKNNSH